MFLKIKSTNYLERVILLNKFSFVLFFLCYFLFSQVIKLFFAHGRWASLMQRRCLRFFEKISFGFFQSRLRRDRTAGGA